MADPMPSRALPPSNSADRSEYSEKSITHTLALGRLRAASHAIWNAMNVFPDPPLLLLNAIACVGMTRDARFRARVSDARVLLGTPRRDAPRRERRERERARDASRALGDGARDGISRVRVARDVARSETRRRRCAG